ncbi:TolC family protein [Alteromonas gracilis]|uniref:TolC family protein n=1 Tax=Alteromonas gracilis TaxID=1479524 RepID=UPI0030CFBA57
MLLLFLTGVSQATSLSVLYDNTTQRLKRVYDVNPEKLQNNADAINHWLQGPASLQLIALPSQEQGGTDEFEVGVFLPFRSLAARELDNQQLALTEAFDIARDKRFSLMTSGLVREALWRRLVARAQVDGLQAKQVWIESLDTLILQLQKTGELDQAAFLRWQQEKLTQQLALRKAHISLERAQLHYRRVMGTDELPEQTTEALSDRLDEKLQAHPELKLLLISQSQLDLNLTQSDQSLSPWTLGLIARQLRGPTGSENLVGVSINIPLSDGTPVSNYASWKEAHNTLNHALAETYTTLQLQLSEALQEVDYLSEALLVLEQQVNLGEEITALYQKQKDALPKTFWLEQLIAQQDLKLDFAMYKVRYAEAISKVNQVAGVTL